MEQVEHVGRVTMSGPFLNGQSVGGRYGLKHTQLTKLTMDAMGVIGKLL